MPYRTHEEVLRMHLSNPRVAAEYLVAAVEEGDREEIRKAINTVLEIHGAGKKYHIKRGGLESVTARSKSIRSSATGRAR